MWLPTNIEGREPIERVTSGPYFVLRFLTIGSSVAKELVSSNKFEDM